MDTTNQNGHRYLSPRQLAEAYPVFSLGAIRKLLFDRGRNGLDAAIIRVGRLIVVDEQAWIAWLRAHAERPPDPGAGSLSGSTRAAQ